MLKRIELKRFEKLVNDKNTVLFTEGNKINYVYNKVTHKRYIPKYEIEIVR